MHLSDMLLSDADFRQRADADRREVDPPVEVESATWSPGGQLDWWVKERQQCSAGYAALTAVNAGLVLVIYVLRVARVRD